jgi:succinoglycan biosynthesis transport protein ExoP
VPSTSERDVDFRHHLRTLQRRKWTIVVVTALAIGIAVGFSYAVTPSYTATATILLQPSPTTAALSSNSSSNTPNIADQIQVLEGSAVASIVRRHIGSSPRISATNPAGNNGTTTNLIQVIATAGKPAIASRTANTYAAAYVSYTRTQSVNTLLAAASTVQSRIAAMQKQEQSQPPSSPLVSALNQQIVVLEQQISTLQSDAALGSSDAQVIRPATVPSSPSSPKKTQNGLIGLLGGVVLGTALAFVRESLDDTIVGREDLDHAQPDLPLLALIPQYTIRKRGGVEVVSVSRPHSDAAEAYRTLRTSVEFTAIDRSLRTLQLTSPRSAEGKTTTVANLATTLAKVGREVIVVDCDLRRSRAHEVFGLDNEVGFTSVLLGTVPLSSALYEVPDAPGLRVLPAGPRPPNPSELLAGERTAEVMSTLADLADLVIIDSPPVLPVTDSVALARRVDALLMVVQAGSTTAKDLARSLEMLGQVDASIIGAVLNAVRPPGRHGYRYGGYGYHYGEYSYGRAPDKGEAARIS